MEIREAWARICCFEADAASAGGCIAVFLFSREFGRSGQESVPEVCAGGRPVMAHIWVCLDAGHELENLAQHEQKILIYTVAAGLYDTILECQLACLPDLHRMCGVSADWDT